MSAERRRGEPRQAAAPGVCPDQGVRRMSTHGLSEESLAELLATLSSLSEALYGSNDDARQIVIPASDAHAPSKAEARYRALVEQIPAITFTVSLEEGATEIYVGPQIEQILGFS